MQKGFGVSEGPPHEQKRQSTSKKILKATDRKKEVDSWQSVTQLGAGPMDRLLHPQPTFSSSVTLSVQSLHVRSAAHEAPEMGLLSVLQKKPRSLPHMEDNSKIQLQ